MSQAAGTAGRPRQDEPPGRVAPASTPMIPAIGSKKDIGMVLQSRHHAVSKALLPAKVCPADEIALNPWFCSPFKAASSVQSHQVDLGRLRMGCYAVPFRKADFNSTLDPSGTHGPSASDPEVWTTA